MTLLKVGKLQRFTRNLIVPLDFHTRSVLVKYTRNPHEAKEEVDGHARLAAHYRIPRLYGTVRVPGGRILAYDRLPIGRDRGLLLDLLNVGEATPTLLDYMESLTASYRSVMTKTAALAHPTEVVRKLYWERAAPGGRLDVYYAERDFQVAEGILDVPVGYLDRIVMVINDQPLHFSWHATLAWARRHFAGETPVWAAISQGDPTDVNLAYPLAWLDYDAAGTNSILGEFANFLWYTTALGGWLAPTYNPAAFVDHPATFTRLASNTPRLHDVQADWSHGRLRIDYSARPAAARLTAARLYWEKLVRPVATELWPGKDLGDLLRPYLVMRILAVYNLADLHPVDRLICLARLAEAMGPEFDPTTFFDLAEHTCHAR